MAQEVLQVLAILGLGLAAAGYIAHRLQLPPALGYIAVGLALTPDAGGLDLIPVEVIEQASHVAVLFLLFFIGLELDLKRLREILRKTAGATFFSITVSALFGSALGRVLGWTLAQSITLGIVMAVSSTIFGERLAAPAAFGQEPRKRVLGILLGEDVGAAGLLAVIVVLGAGGGGWLVPVLSTSRLLFFLILLAGGALLVLPRLMDWVARTHLHELLVLTAAGVVLGFGALGGLAGSAELGAFLAGVATAEAGSRFVVRNAVASLREVALALFLFTAGLLVDVSLVQGHLLLAATLAVAFLAAMLVVNLPAALAAGLDLGGALRVALSLSTVGEFNLILLAAAEAGGTAHPALRATVVGAMVMLLVLVPILLSMVPRMVRAAHRMPRRIRQPLVWLVQSLRRNRPQNLDPRSSRPPIRLLVANVLLLVSWALLAAAFGPRVARQVPDPQGFLGPTIVLGVFVAVAAPLAYGAYRGYRDLVRLLVGVGGPGGGETEGRRLRTRIVDLSVAASAVVLLAPLALLLPNTLPVLLGGLLVAVLIATLAWRQLSRFQHALEGSLTRVLGDDPEAGALLDRLMQKYPWGVRFAAVAIASDSPVAGQTLGASRVAEMTGATVAVLQRRQMEVVNPPSHQVLLPGDTLVLMGDVHQLARAEALLVAHGEALRLTAQSRLAQVVELTVGAGSPLIGLTLGESNLRGSTGTLVVGLWPKGTRHPEPFRPDLTVQEGDQLILLGAPLQVERARLLASPPPPPPAPAATA